MSKKKTGEVTMRYVREILGKRSQEQEIQVFHQPRGLSVWISKYSLLRQRLSPR